MRIDTMLQRDTMTDQNYSYAKRILDGILQETPEDVDAMKRYAKAYQSHAIPLLHIHFVEMSEICTILNHKGAFEQPIINITRAHPAVCMEVYHVNRYYYKTTP